MHADTAAKTRAVRARPSIYGEDIPFERSLLPGWIVSRVEACARAAGLDTYKDENAKEGNVSLLCGGKAVVLDVEFRIRPLHLPSADDIGIGLSSIKISVAPPAEGTALPASPYEIHLDNLFQSLVSEFITLAHAANADCLLAARPMAEFQRHLEYLMHIDRLATEEGEAGARWFRHVGSTAAFAEGICTQEASALSTQVPLYNICPSLLATCRLI